MICVDLEGGAKLQRSLNTLNFTADQSKLGLVFNWFS